MLVLRVQGYDDCDYGALSFEQNVLEIPEKYQELKDKVAAGEKEFSDEEAGWFAKVLEFGEVDPKFIEFIRDEQNYDECKHTNFYVL